MDYSTHLDNGHDAASTAPPLLAPAEESPTRILYVEDNRGDFVLVRELLRDAFGRACELDWAPDETAAATSILQNRHDIYLVDYHLPGSNGLELVQRAIHSAAKVPWILVTGLSKPDIDIEAMSAGASDYLVKSELTAALLSRSIRYALLRQKHMAAENRSTALIERSNKKLTHLYKTAHHFVDNVSHEFRTPLTVIKEFASILNEEIVGPLGADQKEFVGIILNRVEDLSHMVDDMLDISKIESDLLGVERHKCDVHQIIDRTMVTLQRKAKEHHINLHFSIPPLPSVFCDPENIQRVLINLFVNACKFSRDHTKATVWAKYEPGADHVCIGVTDEGPGIPPEKVEAIFERFHQIGSDLGNGSKGFGLGLSIVKELVKVNYGNVALDSRVGEGSTFAFTLPIADERVIVNKFFESLDLLNPGASHATLISVRVDPSAACAVPDMKRRLYQHLRRADIVLPGRPGTWLVCAALSNPEDAGGLADRLAGALGSARNGAGAGPVSVLEVMTSRLGEQKPEFFARVVTELCPISRDDRP